MRSIIDKKKLKILFLLLSIGIPLVCNADVKVTLQWEQNDPSIDGYRIFCREEGQSYDYENFVWQGDKSFDHYTIDGLDEDKTYYFVLRAFIGNRVSEDSNEVRYPNDDNESSGSSSGCMIQSLFN